MRSGRRLATDKSSLFEKQKEASDRQEFPIREAEGGSRLTIVPFLRSGRRLATDLSSLFEKRKEALDIQEFPFRETEGGSQLTRVPFLRSGRRLATYKQAKGFAI